MNWQHEQELKARDKLEKERIENELIQGFLEKAMEARGGKLFLRRLLDYAAVFRSTFNTDANKMFFEEGKRDVGLMIYNYMISSDPERALNFHLKKDEPNEQ